MGVRDLLRARLVSLVVLTLSAESEAAWAIVAELQTEVARLRKTLTFYAEHSGAGNGYALAALAGPAEPCAKCEGSGFLTAEVWADRPDSGVYQRGYRASYPCPDCAPAKPPRERPAGSENPSDSAPWQS
jgi:hypothetical protein